MVVCVHLFLFQVVGVMIHAAGIWCCFGAGYTQHEGMTNMTPARLCRPAPCIGAARLTSSLQESLFLCQVLGVSKQSSVGRLTSPFPTITVPVWCSV